ncbi:MAG: type I pullulanase [Lachnospiraceae bacterium]|nr:type I pullulanase [Lachnospiraceae bacterium]
MTDLYYAGTDLGCTMDHGCTCFRIWAPNATNVTVNLYDSDQALLPMRRIPMSSDVDGTWVCREEVPEHTYYTYMVDNRETQDPYSKAVGCNGRRSMVVDLAKTNPEGFDVDHGPALSNPGDAIICEISILDATGDVSSKAKHRGKYLGLCEGGLVSDTGVPCGLDYFKALGVTHLQLMPVYDFGSIDESRDVIAHPQEYNWGYDPVNYMTPEGSFATDPHDGSVRIREFKSLVQAFHSAGIGVIMDVVFNHTYSLDFCFQKTAPDYFYRKDGDVYSDGSACGNEVASDRPMVRKYILDCLTYWMQEFHLDGYRFDLMGCLDLETMQIVNDTLHRIKPDVLLYGEGWLGGDSVLPEEKRATKANLHTIDGIGAFSDDIRDGIRGHVFTDDAIGFVGGAADCENNIRFSVAGACPHPQVDYKAYTYSPKGAWATTPNRVINYASCHDNMTLWDRLCSTRKDATHEEQLAMNRLAAAIVFTSQGIPFFLHGEEILRSKDFCDNSFNQPLSMNAISYDLTEDQEAMLRYYRGLIAFRKSTPQLHLSDGDAVKKELHFLSTEGLPSVVAYTLRGYLVVYNASPDTVQLPAPVDGTYTAYIQGSMAGDTPLASSTYHAGDSIPIAGISCFVARMEG